MSSTHEPSDCSHSHRALRKQMMRPIESAMSHVERERAEIKAELEAFESFGSRVSDLTAQEGEEFRPLGDNTVADTAAIRTAYRETVMAVDHYEKEYGESLLESITAELGPEIAGFLGSQQPITEFHRAVVVNATAGCIQTREQVLDRTKREMDSLKNSQNELSTLLRRLERACEPDDGEIMERIQSVSQHRQQVLHRKLPYTSDDEHHFRTYLYDDEEWTYPVLTAIARLKESLEEG